MSKIESKNRIVLPSHITSICNIDLHKEVRLYLYTDYKPNALLVSNKTDLALPCLGIINVNEKNRFTLRKEHHNLLKVTPNTEFSVYSYKGNLVIEIL